MNRTPWSAALAALLAAGLGSSALAAPRFEPLPADKLTAEQREIPLVKRALEAGRYNPTGLDAILARNPGLQQAIGAMASETYPVAAKLYMGRDDPPSVPPALMEIGILVVSKYWDFPAMFRSHGPLALKDGLSQATVDALAAGRRPAGMTPAQAAVHDYAAELMKTRAVSDATFAELRRHLSERQVLDLVSTLSTYVGSLMLLKTADVGAH